METRVFDGGHAAIATIDVGGTVPASLRADLEAIPHVLGISTATLPAEGT
jgi:D-3-phosphoglycerate dehydrogenase